MLKKLASLANGNINPLHSPYKLEEKLAHLLKLGHSDLVVSLLNQHTNPNYEDLLFTAVEYKQHEFIRKLIPKATSGILNESESSLFNAENYNSLIALALKSNNLNVYDAVIDLAEAYGGILFAKDTLFQHTYHIIDNQAIAWFIEKSEQYKKQLPKSNKVYDEMTWTFVWAGHTEDVRDTEFLSTFYRFLYETESEESVISHLTKLSKDLHECISEIGYESLSHKAKIKQIITNIFTFFIGNNNTNFLYNLLSADNGTIIKLFLELDINKPIINTINYLNEHDADLPEDIMSVYENTNTLTHLIFFDEYLEIPIEACGDTVSDSAEMLGYLWLTSTNSQATYNAKEGFNFKLSAINDMVNQRNINALDMFHRVLNSFGYLYTYLEAMTFLTDTYDNAESKVKKNDHEFIVNLFEKFYDQYGAELTKLYISKMHVNERAYFLDLALDSNTEIVKRFTDLILKLDANSNSKDFFIKIIIKYMPDILINSSHDEEGGLATRLYLIGLMNDTQIEVIKNEYNQIFFDYIKGDIPKTKFLQNMSRNAERWLLMTGDNAPDESLEKTSPYRFKKKIYDQILPYMKTASIVEGNSLAEIHAYKLSVVFSSLEEIDAYLTRFANIWGKDSSQPIHDSCLFELPTEGLWKPSHWKKLLFAHGPDIYKFIKSAPYYESRLQDKKFSASLDSIEALKSMVSYKRSEENRQLAELMVKYGYNERNFNFILDHHEKNKKLSDQIPSIEIDGQDIGHPDFYFERLAPDNPMGYFLGFETNCCQYVGGNGKDCAYYGMQHELSGFYVWKQKTKGEKTSKDQIVAQSWVWIGQDDSLVFDSFERRRSIHNQLLLPFLQQFSYEVSGHYEYTPQNSYVRKIKRVTLGHMGATPSLGLSKIKDPSVPYDYNGKYEGGVVARDSEQQYLMQPIDHKNLPQTDLKVYEHTQEIDQLAKTYIEFVTGELSRRFNIAVKAGIEIECYAIKKDGTTTPEIIDVSRVNADFKSAGLPTTFDHENTEDYYGQYEFSTPPLEPVEAVRITEFMEQNLLKFLKEYGLRKFDFSTLPYEDKEASGMHISFSLWQDNNPLFADKNHMITPLALKLADATLSVQSQFSLMVASYDQDYQRYNNTPWSPCSIKLAYAGNEGATLRLANENGNYKCSREGRPENTRLENRLPSGSTSRWVAMALTLAPLEFLLQNGSEFLNRIKSFNSQDLEDMGNRLRDNSFGLPVNRREALEISLTAINDNTLKLSDHFINLAKSITKAHISKQLQENINLGISPS